MLRTLFHSNKLHHKKYNSNKFKRKKKQNFEEIKMEFGKIN